MRLAVLHLSDIHTHGKSDGVIKKAKEIASGFFEYARNSDGCLIILTGDIAFGGQEKEYQAASTLLLEIKQLVQDEIGSKQIDIILIPGNHDCILNPENKVRTLAVEQVIEKNELASDDDIVEHCTLVQNNYFNFRDDITDSQPVNDHKLWTEYELKIAGETVRISAINAAWMSRIPEVPGQLVFPIDSFTEIGEHPASLRLSLLHHPLNWYAQQSYHPLRKHLRKNSHAILSGHEHSISSGEIRDAIEGGCLYFEAPALQPHEKHLIPGFSCLLFNLDNSDVKEKRYQITSKGLVQTNEEIHHDFPKISNHHHVFSGLSKEMVLRLSDAGGNFIHPYKGELCADDVFVYPELKDRSSENNNIITADKIDIYGKDECKVLILGDEKSGKSFLLNRYFRNIHTNGNLPLYIKANDIKSVSSSELQKTLNRLSKDQYENANDFLLAKKSERVALVDDLDKCPGESKNKHLLISFLENNFNSVIVSGSTSMELSELVDKDVAESLDEYSTYELQSFGHLMRHMLIKKWCLCSNVETTIDLDKKIHETESLIDSVLGRNLVPSRPIYLLILLQSSQTQNQEELQNSGLSYYYQFMITKSLRENGVRPDKFNEIFNYISQLAWFYQNDGGSEIERSSLRGFNTIFSEKYTSVDFESRLELLLKAKILSKSGDYFSFMYPYVYYFFLGKFLAANIHKEEIKDLVSSYCENLNNTKKASCILFLSHHSNEPWLIDKISESTAFCFDDKKPLNIENDVESLNALVDSTSELIISDLDVDKNQEKHHKIADKYDSSDMAEEDDGTSSTIELINTYNKLMKTNEILGQITKNYYGSIERSKKEEYLSIIFDGSLRMLRSIFDEIIRDPDLFVKGIEKSMAENSKKSKKKIKKHSRKITFDLIGMICTGLIGKTSRCVSSDMLREDISAVVSDNGSNAYRLIGAATRLLHPGNIPFDELTKLANSLEDNIFAFTILQSLIAYHLHMFHTTDSEKQRLCMIAKITMSNARSLEMSNIRSLETKRK